MNLADAVLSIQTLITPVVMISACALLLLGMLNRYGRINDRLRELTRERIGLLPSKGEPLPDAHLHAIDRQLPELLKRNLFLRNAVLCLFMAIICFILAVFLIGAALLRGPFAARAAIAAFILGAGLLLAGMLFMAREIHGSHRAVSYETDLVMKL